MDYGKLDVFCSELKIEVFMTDKELQKLTRAELLELLLKQTKRVEELEEKIQKNEEEFQEQKAIFEKKIENRQITVEKAGSIAEASLNLNEVFEVAQKAADQYLENIKDMWYQQELMYSQKKDECDAMLDNTYEYCAKMKERIQKRCDALEKDTVNRCKRMEEEALQRCKDMMRKYRDEMMKVKE